MLIFVAAAGTTAVGCADDRYRLECDDLLPEAEAVYDEVAALVVDSGSKSCGGCHNGDAPIGGYNFEARGVAYDALVSKIEIIYANVASQQMPVEGEPWNEDDLRLLRSWYCHGAFFD